LRGRQKLPHPAAEPVSLHDSEIAADEVVDQVPMSTHGTFRARAMSDSSPLFAPKHRNSTAANPKRFRSHTFDLR
jgi:hypothetical protein